MSEKPTFEEFIKIMAERMGFTVTPAQMEILKYMEQGKRLYFNLPLHILRKG